MADDFWRGRFKASYRFMRVDRRTGLETGRVGNITGGTITRNQDTSVYETANIDYVGSLDMGTDLLRIYLDAESTNGNDSRTVALGTFLVSTPSIEFDGTKRSGTADLYGRLRELADDDFDTAYQVDAGENAVAKAAAIARAAGLTVVADPSTYTLTAPWTFGVSGGSDSVSDKLSAINKLLDAAGFNAAYTDPMGRVIMSRYTAQGKRPLVWDFEEGEGCHVLPQATDELDRLAISNVVHVDYTTQESSVRGTAVDDDPDSEWSTVSVGRRIVKSYSYSSLPEGTTADQAQALANTKALELLKSERSILRRVTFTTMYVPVNVGDAHGFESSTLKINRRYAARKIDISLKAGCPMKIESRNFGEV